MVGPVTTSDGKLQIATKTSGTVEAPKEEVTLIRNDAGQQAYEKSLDPGLLHGWNGGVSIGFSVARGNSQSENLALAFNAVHPTLHDKMTLYATAIDTKNDLATPSTVANLSQDGFRYDRDIDSWNFFFSAPPTSCPMSCNSLTSVRFTVAASDATRSNPIAPFSISSPA